MLTRTEYEALAKTGVPAEGRIAGALRGGWYVPAQGLFIASVPIGAYHAAPAADIADFRVHGVAS